MDLFRQNLRLELARSDLKGLPESPLPKGYSLRWFRSGDAAHWLRIHHDADPFNEIRPELFNRQFGCDLERLSNCQCYLEDAAGRVVGTGTAWSASERQDGRWGRIFWLAILRHYQGRGLGKPLLAVVCNRLLELGYDHACVVTSTGRLPAVSLYLQFGFQPEIHTDEDRAIWDRVFTALRDAGRLKEPAAAA
jgi:GNAT superfamily N-acetyltransferase